MRLVTRMFALGTLCLSSLCACGVSLSAADSKEGETVYSNGFDKPPGEEWSSRQTMETPEGKRRFLGDFAPGTVTLTLDGLAKHKMVRIVFDLYLVRSWDGSSTTWGPDVWELKTGDGRKLVHSTFTNCGFFSDNNAQTFPDFHPFPVTHPGATGAAEHETLGFVMGWDGRPHSTDAVYHFDLVFPHAGKKLVLDFSSICKDKKEDQSWGLDNVKVQILTAPLPLEKGGDGSALWDALASSNPVVAYRAMWKLIGAGKEGVDYLRKHLSESGCDVAKERKEIDKLILELDADKYSERENASKKLARTGGAYRDILERVSKNSKSPEVRYRLKKILRGMGSEVGSGTDKKTIRRARIKHALEILSTNEN